MSAIFGPDYEAEGLEIDVLRGLDLKRWHPRLIRTKTWP